jgi:hypothetical protein
VNYSPVAIANMSLQRIGARGTIGSLTEQTPNAIKVNVVWDMVFQEVLSEREWKFAKTRVALQQNAQAPVGGYKFAYPLPADYLRLVRPREIPEERRIADAAEWGWGGEGYGWFRHRDIPVHPHEAVPYVIEAVLNADGVSYTNNLLSNYPHCDNYATARPIVINYIRLITDFTQLLPGFVNCLAYRLAGELALAITEDENKAKSMMQMYYTTLNSAAAQQECDYLQDETGNYNFIHAGRCFGPWGAHR